MVDDDKLWMNTSQLPKLLVHRLPTYAMTSVGFISSNGYKILTTKLDEWMVMKNVSEVSIITCGFCGTKIGAKTNEMFYWGGSIYLFRQIHIDFESYFLMKKGN